MLDAVEKTSLLSDEDWFFYSIFRMSNYKVDVWDLQHKWTYIDCLKIREFLLIEQTKEEAIRKDADLNKG